VKHISVQHTKTSTSSSTDHTHTEAVAFGFLPYPTSQIDYSPAEVDDDTLSPHPDLPEEHNLRHYYYNRSCIRPVDETDHVAPVEEDIFCLRVGDRVDSTLVRDNLYFGKPLGYSYHGENVTYCRVPSQLPEDLTGNMDHRQLLGDRAGDLAVEVADDLGQPGQEYNLPDQGDDLVGGTIETYMRWRKVGAAHAYDRGNHFGQALFVSY